MAINDEKLLKTCMVAPPNITGSSSKLSGAGNFPVEGRFGPERMRIRYNGTPILHSI